MKIKEINNKEVWEGFLWQCQEKTFLDSWNWVEFQKMEGNKIWRLGIYNSNQLIGLALVVKVKARRGTFLFLPHGPVLSSQSIKEGAKFLLKELSSFIIKLAKQEKASFIRISPIWQRNEKNNKIFKELGFREAPIHIHPELTWELDITSSEEEILMGMRKTTRYLIRQAQKNSDIEIIKSQNVEDLKKFNEIYCTTAKRHQFVPFSLDYLQNEFLSFLPDNQILIFLGKYKNEIVSTAIVIFWQGIGFYHHGASLLKYNKIPVSYLLQWEGIKEAKRRGCKFYNFWGIVPVFAIAKTGTIPNSQFPISNKILNPKFQIIINKKHPWYGLTIFKTGFGGYQKEYVKTQDLPLSINYRLTFIIEKIRKIKRGL